MTYRPPPPPGYPQQYQPPPPPPKRGLTTKTIVIGIAVFVVAALLVIAVIAVAAGGGSDDEAGTDQAGNPATSAQNRAGAPSSGAEDVRRRVMAEWDDPSDEPKGRIHITAAYPLPAAMVRELGECAGDRCALQQHQTGDIGVRANNNTPSLVASGKVHVVTFAQDGTQKGDELYPYYDAAPEPSDLQEEADENTYYRMTAADGITLPAAARGNRPEMFMALRVLPDAYDEGRTTLWILLRGGDHLYKAEVCED